MIDYLKPEQLFNGNLGIIKLPSKEADKEIYIFSKYNNCYIDLNALRKPILNFTRNDRPFKISDLLGVTIFGSSVSFPPGYTTWVKNWDTWKVKVDYTVPNDIDVMTITSDSFNGSQKIQRTIHTQDTLGISRVNNGEIDISLDNRGKEQLINGIKSGQDTVGLNSIKHGIVICANDEFISLLNFLRKELKVEQESPYNLELKKSRIGKKIYGVIR